MNTYKLSPYKRAEPELDVHEILVLGLGQTFTLCIGNTYEQVIKSIKSILSIR